MNKINKNKISNIVISALFLIAILASGTIGLMPTVAKADYYSGGENTIFGANPVPTISYLNPNNVSVKNSSFDVAVFGNGFVPESIVEFDHSYRETSYNSTSELTVTLTAGDLSAPATHVITVYSPGDGGGISNELYFTVHSPASIRPVATSTIRKTTYVNRSTSSATNSNGAAASGSAQEVNDLGASAIFGSGGFFPTGLIGWLILAILILIIVVLARKFFGLEKKYQSTPLKHS